MSGRQRLLVAAMISTALGILGGGHYYVMRRLVLESGVAEPLVAPLSALVAVLGLTLVIEPIGQRRWPRHLARPLAWVASLWLGVWFLTIVWLLISDLALWALGPRDPELADRLQAGSVVGAVLASAVFATISALRGPRLVRIELYPLQWPRALDGFRIVQLSDLHIGPILDRRFVRSVVERVNALEPDLVAITGDLADGRAEQLAAEAAPLADLRARHGVFFVTGNHDHYSGVRGWLELVAQLGIRALRNERVAIRVGHEVFDLAGVDDYRGGWRGSTQDLEKALLGRDPGRSAILLAHDPSTFPEAARAGVDLQLSGHTHGGQIWPFCYAVRLFVPFVAGLYRRAASQLYVSRGTGFWGAPMRLFAPAEITEITLRARLSPRNEHGPRKP